MNPTLTSRCPGVAGGAGVPGLAAGPGERQQESRSGPTDGVQVVGRRQGGLRVGVFQQLDLQDPSEQKVAGFLTPLLHVGPACQTCLCLKHSQNNFVAIVDLPEGEHQYKFCVDGQWILDPTGVSALPALSAPSSWCFSPAGRVLAGRRDVEDRDGEQRDPGEEDGL